MKSIADSPLDGLWSYETIKIPDGTTERLTGYFLFYRGFLAQQAIHDGEPFESQIAQAHVGKYELAEVDPTGHGHRREPRIRRSTGQQGKKSPSPDLTGLLNR